MTDERKPNPQTQLTLEEHLADKTPIIQRIDDARFNIGYVALDIAKEAGLGVTLKSYQILKKIIDEAKKWIDTKPEYDRFDGFRKFKAIDGIIKEAGFRVKHGDGERFIKEGFETDEISCLPPVLIYLSVAEALGLPIRAVNTPRHISVIWEPFGERSFYWDPTMAEDCGVEVTKEQYIEMFNLEPKHIAEGLLLNVLDRKQVLARVFNNRGIARQDTDITGALHDFQESARLDPNYADVYPGIAGIYLLKGDYDKALENSERAVALNPTLSTAFMLRGFCYAVKKKSAGARAKRPPSICSLFHDCPVISCRGASLNRSCQTIELYPCLHCYT